MFKKPMSLSKIIDLVDVPVLSSVAIGITFIDVENTLKLLSLLTAIGYTSWKWQKDYKQSNIKKPVSKLKKQSK